MSHAGCQSAHKIDFPDRRLKLTPDVALTAAALCPRRSWSAKALRSRGERGPVKSRLLKIRRGS